MVQHSGTVIIADEPILGLAQRHDPLADLPPEEAAEKLRAHALATDLPLPGGRGVPQVFAWIVQRLRGRQLVDDLGEHSAEVDWLALHVPPKGTASLVLRNRSEDRVGVTLKLLGSGYGNGRAVQLEVSEDFLERSRCARLVQRVDVHVRSYGGSSDEGRELRADVVRVRHTQVKPWDVCPLCGTPEAAVDPFLYEQAGPGVDLSQDDTGHKRSEVFELESSAEHELGLDLTLPGVGATQAGITARRSLNLTCQVDYSFPARRRFTPFKAIGPLLDLPFWGVD